VTSEKVSPGRLLASAYASQAPAARTRAPTIASPVSMSTMYARPRGLGMGYPGNTLGVTNELPQGGAHERGIHRPGGHVDRRQAGVLWGVANAVSELRWVTEAAVWREVMGEYLTRRCYDR